MTTMEALATKTNYIDVHVETKNNLIQQDQVPPPPGWRKVNAAVTFIKSTCICFLAEQERNICWGTIRGYSACCAREAELLAIGLGLQVVKAKGEVVVVLESDA